MKKYKAGCVQLVVESGSFRAALKAVQQVFGAKTTFVMNPTGFCFGGYNKHKLMYASFSVHNLQGYGYYIRYNTDAEVPEFAFTCSIADILNSPAMQATDKKRTVDMYIEIKEDGSLREGLNIKHSSGSAVTPVDAVRCEPLIFTDHIAQDYKNCVPNDTPCLEPFCESMQAGNNKKGRSANKFIEFRLLSTGKVVCLWKTMSTALPTDPSAIAADPTGEGQRNTSKDYGELATAKLDVYLSYTAPIEQPTILHTITISTEDAQAYKLLQKISNLSVVQCYMAKNAPLVFRIALNHQGHILLAYMLDAPIRAETPVTKAPAVTQQRGGRTANTARKEVDN